MNYKKIYDQLMEKAKAQNRKKFPKSDPKYQYFETHHIIPKSLGGTNERSNLVYLTFYEHYIVHLLLVKHFKIIRDENSYYKMVKALTAFENLNFGTVRNGLFFSSKLFKKLSRSYVMPQSTKDKLSCAKTGKKWTENQRKANEAYYKRIRDAGIKLIPWNKGVPIREDIREKIKKTLTYCNKTRGRKPPLEERIRVTRTKLEHKYSSVNFSNFDFEVYLSVPRKEKFKKCDGELQGKYVRHELLNSFLLTQISQEEIDDIMKTWQEDRPTLNKKGKMCLKGKIRIFRRRFEKYYNVDFSDFNFEKYFEIKNENDKIQRTSRKQFVLDYVKEMEEKMSVVYFF